MGIGYGGHRHRGKGVGKAPFNIRAGRDLKRCLPAGVKRGMSEMSDQQRLQADKYWLLWDGECGFCRRAVFWALARDQVGLLAALPYQQAPWPPMDENLALACRRAVHLRHPDGRLEGAGRACLRVLELVGYRRTAHWLRLPPLVWGVELGYWLVARNRMVFSRLLFRRRP